MWVAMVLDVGVAVLLDAGVVGIQVLVGMHSALPAEITAATLMVWLVVYTV